MQVNLRIFKGQCVCMYVTLLLRPLKHFGPVSNTQIKTNTKLPHILEIAADLL